VASFGAYFFRSFSISASRFSRNARLSFARKSPSLVPGATAWPTVGQWKMGSVAVE
jgi:hypothetical protein